jgi:hypothetical protein
MRHILVLAILLAGCSLERFFTASAAAEKILNDPAVRDVGGMIPLGGIVLPLLAAIATAVHQFTRARLEQQKRVQAETAVTEMVPRVEVLKDLAADKPGLRAWKTETRESYSAPTAALVEKVRHQP